MAQYEKLINLSLLNQFLTKAKTIFAPKITASGILKGDGAGNVSAATAGTDYVTPAQSLALGLTGASVGNLVRVNAVDASGQPTSWKHVPLCEIKCNKNLLDNWYFVGGGSQLGDGVFPINQRWQAGYTNPGYTYDRWSIENSAGRVNLNANDMWFYSDAVNNVQFYQVVDDSKLIDGATYTMSVLLSYSTGLFRMFLGGKSSPYPSIGSVDITSAGLVTKTFTFNRGSYTGSYKFALASKGTAQQALWVKAVKLELGSEQTLCHNEGTEANPIWVLNEIPDYETELLRCISSHADTSDKFANKDYSSALKVGPRIESGDDLDNYRYVYQAGTYAIASGVANSPESWSIALVIPSPSGGCKQIAFGAAKIYLRAYAGSPLAWSAWKSITLS